MITPKTAAPAHRADERRIEALQEHYPDADLSTLHVALALGRASVSVDRVLADRIRKYQLSPVALQTLISVLLAGKGPIALSSLGEELRVTKANVSFVLGRLEKQGLIKRAADPSDGRRIRVTLTRRGRAIVDELVPLALESLEESFAHLSARERTDLIRLCSQIG